MAAAYAADLLTLYRILSNNCRRQLLIVSLLIPATAMAETLMVAAIVPFLALIGGDSDLKSLLLGPLEFLDRYLPANDVAAAAFLFVATAIAANALRLYLARASHRFAAGLGHELNVAIQRRMLHQPYLFHMSSHSSRLLAALDKVDELAFGAALRGLQAVGSGFISAALILTLLAIDPASGTVAILGIVLLYGAALLSVRNRFNQGAETLNRAQDRRIQIVQENLGGIRDIILEGSQDARLGSFEAIERQLAEARASTSFLAAAPRFVVEGIGLAMVAVLALFMAGKQGGLTAALPVLGALALGAQRLLPLASQLYSAWVSVAISKPMLSEVASLLRLPVEVSRAQRAELPFCKAIVLEGVSFHYPDRARAAVHSIDLAIPHGSRVAIVGPSGAGKSTLADLLMGLIEPTHGQIRIDGELLAGPALAAWCQSVSHVPQSVFLSDASIARNIAFEATDAVDMPRIERAAAIAQLNEFIASLPERYETHVGERGVRLSGGQRQRLALARAVYRQTPFLVLDEATSALDDRTESAILQSLARLQEEGVTVLIVAHRLSTVRTCDRIFALENGSIIQSGSFTEMFGRLNRLHERGEL